MIKVFTQESSDKEILNALTVYKEETKKSWKEIAGEADVNDSQLSTFKNNPANYTGNVVRMRTNLIEYLNIVQEQKQFKKLEFEVAQTSQLSRIIMTCKECHNNGEMGAVWGQAGMGKSTCIHHYARNFKSQVHIVDAYEGITPVDLMQEFLVLFGITMGGTENNKMDQVIGTVKGKPWLLVIDDAHYLKPNLIEKIRHIWDKSKVGILYVGNDTVIDRMKGGGKMIYFSHVFSRLYNRCGLKEKPDMMDVAGIFKKAGIHFSKDVLKCLTRIAQSEGRYRTMLNIFRKAYRIAAEEKEELKVDHIFTAASVYLNWDLNEM
jgi:DNA transposition AAA+ family ATPase